MAVPLVYGKRLPVKPGLMERYTMGQQPKVSRVETTHGGEYTIIVEGASRPAHLTWKRRGDARLVDHTFVPPEARGQGLAAKLVEAIVDDARVDGFLIIPQCSYAVALFDRHPEWADLRG